ncbi:hypothetical protein WL96_12700 [Burkholderia vietnamiensis]|nr:hypothetical protein WL96_12700 [Burkholderia vietnamiensis]
MIVDIKMLNLTFWPKIETNPPVIRTTRFEHNELEKSKLMLRTVQKQFRNLRRIRERIAHISQDIFFTHKRVEGRTKLLALDHTISIFIEILK